MVAILGSMLSKLAADTRDKKVGSIIRLPGVLTNYNKGKKYPNLSAGVTATKDPPKLGVSA